MSDIYQMSIDETIDDMSFEDDSNEEPVFTEEMKDLSQAILWGTDWTLETLALQMAKGNIDINPSFQRRDAWDDAKKSSLIESLILRMPVPAITLAEKKDERGKYLVIDGKQRLLTICQFCVQNDQFQKLKLSGLKILTALNGKTYNDLEGPLSESKDMFDNQTLRTNIVKNWPHEPFLYTVFHRLNTGTLKLSPQELRQALHPGDFVTFLDKATIESESFHRMLNKKSADPRMKDVELALRAFAWKYRFEAYRGDLKDFLDGTCEHLNELWVTKENEIKKYFKEIENAIDFTFEVFKEMAFSKPNNRRRVFNTALYEVFIYYFSIPEVRENITNEKMDKITEGFIRLCKDDNKFHQCISGSFKNVDNVYYRFTKIYELLVSIVDTQIPRIDMGSEGFTVVMGAANN